METSVMREPARREGLEIKAEGIKKRPVLPLLNAVSPLPYHFCAGRYQRFGTETGSRTLRLHED
jgi:hypothetical protein